MSAMKYIDSYIKTYIHTKPFIRKPSRVFAASNKTSMEDHQSYIDSHSIQQRVEDVINDVVKSKPAQPFVHMVCMHACLISKRRKIIGTSTDYLGQCVV